jgi:hypothetical protein
MNRSFIVTLLLILNLVLWSTVAIVWAPLARADTPLQVYVATTGTDTNDGLTTDTPVLTLDRVEELLEAEAPGTDVEVRISQGTYINNQTNWHYRIPGHTISFLPIDYQYGNGYGSIAGRPVFRSDGSYDYWFKVTPGPEDLGGTFGLRFFYLQVERYAMGGMEFRGSDEVNEDGVRVPVGGGVNGNYFFGMLFKQIGNKWNSAGVGYAGLVLSNSSDNVITNSHFQYLENLAPNGNLMHGLYIEHGANRNQVYSNSFLYVTSDAAHTRNQARDNNIYSNKFTRTGGAGTTGYYGEWFCDGTCVPHECASTGNLFHNNDIVSGYSGGTVPLFTFAPPGLNYAGGATCDNEGEPRLSTWGNA